MTVLRLVDKNNNQQSVIDLAEKLLECAKNGTVIGIAIAGIDADRDLFWQTAFNGKWAQCVAALTCLQHEIMVDSTGENVGSIK